MSCFKYYLMNIEGAGFNFFQIDIWFFIGEGIEE